MIGRGHHPEWYIFRIPIIDCYLTTDHNNQYITFGPKLTDTDIKNLEDLANLRPDNYKRMYNANRPSLVLMKKLYDNAISKTPLLTDIDITTIPENKLQEYYDKENRSCVDKLIKMKG